MRIVPVPCLTDNYAYLVIASGGEAAVVDASEAEPVRAALRREGARLAAIWSTHHHLDHVGGNAELAREAKIDVVAHVSDQGRVPAQTRGVDTGDTVRVGDIEAKCIHIPGHTLGAVAYVVDAGAERAVFTGDTLFCAGCGRIFEGTPAQMHASLERLAALPGDTRVYCGHEYTANNLRFAAHVEPGNDAVARAQERVSALRARGEPSVGTTIDEERADNPFLRVASAEIRAKLAIPKQADEVAAFAAIRAAKDSFR
ncbi:MAG TPA: hydroxyacylglutathione hydrolase [Polyangiaceae bacterium]|jgi:hydroxyacylglutathione hydrolase